DTRNGPMFERQCTLATRANCPCLSWEPRYWRSPARNSGAGFLCLMPKAWPPRSKHTDRLMAYARCPSLVGLRARRGHELLAPDADLGGALGLAHDDVHVAHEPGRRPVRRDDRHYRRPDLRRATHDADPLRDPPSHAPGLPLRLAPRPRGTCGGVRCTL